MSNVAIDTDVVKAFLRALHPSGECNYGYFINEPRVRKDTFFKYHRFAWDVEGIPGVIESIPANKDMYVHIGDIKPGKNGKASKAKMLGSRWVWCDRDAQTGETADDCVKSLTDAFDWDIIVRSGTGAWGLAQLDDCYPKEVIEPINKAIKNRVGGNVSGGEIDVCRIMRLAGTVNQKNGALATFEVLDADRVRTPDDFPKEEAQSVEVVPLPLPGDGVEILELPGWEGYVGEEWPGLKPDDVYDFLDYPAQKFALQKSRPEDGASRNENALAFMRSCVSDDVPHWVILGLAVCDGLPVAEYYLRDSDGKPRRDALAKAQKDLAKVQTTTRKVDPHWREVDNDGNPRKSYYNTRVAIQKLGITTRYDTFTRHAFLEDHRLVEFAGQISDRALGVVRDIINDDFHFDPGKDNTTDAVASLCSANSFDSLLDYLNGLEWDGVPRLENWLVRLCGAEDTDYVKAVGVLLLKAMCGRARQAGIKYDYMVVFEGAQGVGKSSVAQVLAGGLSWFSDAPLLKLRDGKSRGELMQGIWVNEIAELVGLTKGDQEDLKQFISAPKDDYRAAYGRTVESHFRRNVFIGTTNETEAWMNDPSGGRRYLPVTLGAIDLEGLGAERDQLIAEADPLFNQEPELLLPKELWAEAARQQAKRQGEDPWIDILRSYHGTMRDGKEYAKSADILTKTLDFKPHQLRSPKLAVRLKRVMETLGWTHAPNGLGIYKDKAKGYWREALPVEEPEELPF